MPEQPADLNVTVEKKGVDTWRIVERIGIAVVLLFALGTHFLKQDSSKQDFIQKNASDLATQSKLDRQEERLNAQKTQEDLVKVITSQVAATVEQTAEQRESRATNVKVVESLDNFSDKADHLIERVDRLVDHVEEPK